MSFLRIKVFIYSRCPLFIAIEVNDGSLTTLTLLTARLGSGKRFSPSAAGGALLHNLALNSSMSRRVGELLQLLVRGKLLND